MDFMLQFTPEKAERLIRHGEKILSVGSCFTEHIGNALSSLKFEVLQNPNGILFDPVSVARSITSYIRNERYGAEQLFRQGEIWNAWTHHSRFSGPDKEEVLARINRSQEQAHQFLKEASWLIITLGSSFSYRLNGTTYTAEAAGAAHLPGLQEAGVANCHRAPAQWFRKHLLSIDETVAQLDNMIHQLFRFNPSIQIIFTISPVRHIRDGVVENNRSKARLLEAVHHLVGKFDRLFYFPSYELVIDILRDYRFYSEDMVHPNYLATEYVLEQFIRTFMSDETAVLVKEIKKLNVARKHAPSHPSTEAHKRFMSIYLEKTRQLQDQYPVLNLGEELVYFSSE
ncbi:MAG TPA: GSCFA domain-containing protein [Flavisolibacter sp.]